MDTSLAATTTSPGLRSALMNRNMRLLWAGETVSQLGDQFYLIGLPLLIFSLTGSSAQLGLILLVEGLPRAALMLFGGVITDRVSPRRVMIVSNNARLLITIVLAALILTQTVQIWVLFIAAFLFGSVDAFFQPAFMAIIPGLVKPEALQAGNSLMQSSSQTIQSIGPGVGGAVVSWLGIGVAILLDAFTFLFAAIALLAMRPSAADRLEAPAAGQKQTIRSIGVDVLSMLRYVLSHEVLRPYIFLILVTNLSLVGPSTVGVVVLAKTQFGGSALALGVMLSAMGIGAVLGGLLSGAVKIKRFGDLFLASLVVDGVFLAVIGFAASLWLIALLFGILGLILGFNNVLLLTWFGKQIPPDMMGRFMSLYVLLGIGMAPISNALVGFTFSVSIAGTFVVTGAILLVAGLLALGNPVLRRMEL